MKKKIDSSKAFQSKKDHAFAREIVKVFAESAFINGQLSIEDFSDKKVIRKKLLQILPKRDEDLFFTIVYQPTLLEKGARFAKRKEYELAYVFYATYFEHFINEILDIWAKRNLVVYDTSSNLIRRVSLEDKYTWILNLLKLPSFNRTHWRTIKSISDKRNNFIHYKYKSEAASTPSTAEKTEWEKDSKNVLKAVTYTRRYRSRVVFDGKKKKFKM